MWLSIIAIVNKLLLCAFEQINALLKSHESPSLFKKIVLTYCSSDINHVLRVCIFKEERKREKKVA